MTEQEKIEQAALVYGVANAYTGEMAEVTQDNTAKWAETDFKAGASYHASEIMPGMMVAFAEWVVPKVFAWLNDPESDKDLIYADLAKQFLSHLKHNQDAGSESGKHG